MIGKTKKIRGAVKKGITIIIGMCVVLWWSSVKDLFGQEAAIPANMDILYNRCQVVCKNGQFHFGLLAGVMDRGLVLRIEKKDKVIPYDELAHVVIEGKKGGGAYIQAGMVLGFYIGNIAFHRGSDEPPFQMEKHSFWSMAYQNAVYITAGGGLGFLVSRIVGKKKQEFEFTGDEKKRLKEWDRLQWFVAGTGGTRPKKIHFAVQGGYVSRWTTDKYKSLMQNSGYYVYDYMDDYREVTKVSLLRKVQLTYSPLAKAEFGAAVYFLGGTAISGYKSSDYEAPYAYHAFDANCYYAVAAFHPFSPGRLGSFDWSLGVGAGVADLDFEFRSEAYGGTPYGWGKVTVDGFQISKRMFSGVVYTELTIGLQTGVSIGVVADYVFMPKLEVPAIERAGISGQRLSLGNASFGLVAGFHF